MANKKLHKKELMILILMASIFSDARAGAEEEELFSNANLERTDGRKSEVQKSEKLDSLSKKRSSTFTDRTWSQSEGERQKLTELSQQLERYIQTRSLSDVENAKKSYEEMEINFKELIQHFSKNKTILDLRKKESKGTFSTIMRTLNGRKESESVELARKDVKDGFKKKLTSFGIVFRNSEKSFAPEIFESAEKMIRAAENYILPQIESIDEPNGDFAKKEVNFSYEVSLNAISVLMSFQKTFWKAVKEYLNIQKELKELGDKNPISQSLPVEGKSEEVSRGAAFRLFQIGKALARKGKAIVQKGVKTVKNAAGYQEDPVEKDEKIRVLYEKLAENQKEFQSIYKKAYAMTEFFKKSKAMLQKAKEIFEKERTNRDEKSRKSENASMFWKIAGLGTGAIGFAADLVLDGAANFGVFQALIPELKKNRIELSQIQKTLREEMKKIRPKEYKELLKNLENDLKVE